jgi:transcriptional regulator with XRE-family HTH domain
LKYKQSELVGYFWVLFVRFSVQPVARSAQLMANGPFIGFGKRITAHRQRLGWSVTEAARQMHVPRTSMSRWEHGHEMPRGENMIKLHDHLRMPIGTEEAGQITNSSLEVACQLMLPFDQAANLELKVIRKTQDVVQLELRLKGFAG